MPILSNVPKIELTQEPAANPTPPASKGNKNTNGIITPFASLAINQQVKQHPPSK